jgi:hypothetical protein
MENLVDLGLRENLQTQPKYDFARKMGVETMGFITDRTERRIVQNNTKFMVTRCFESNHRSSVTHPSVQGLNIMVATGGIYLHENRRLQKARENPNELANNPRSLVGSRRYFILGY